MRATRRRADRGTPPVLAAAAPALLAILISAGRAGAVEVVATVVDTAGHPVPEAVVFLTGEGLPAVPPREPYILDQVDKEFVPHVLPIVAGSRVRFPNRDNIHHHVYSFSKTKAFELQLYKGEPAAPVLFEQPGVVKVGCNIHDWMSAVVLVLPNAHFAMTDSGGRATLAGVPEAPGLKLQVFHERLKGPVEATAQAPGPASGGRAAHRWELALKPERKKSQSAFGY